MSGHTSFMNVPTTGLATTAHQRVAWDKGSDSFVVKGELGFKGKVANWFRNTFRSDTVKRENVETYRAIKLAYKNAHGGQPMPLAMRAAMSPSRGATITSAGLVRMDAAEAGNSDLRTKFAAIGAAVPDKLTVHDNRKTHGEPAVLGRGAFNTVWKHRYNVRAEGGEHVLCDKAIKPLRPPQPGEKAGWVSVETGIHVSTGRWAERNMAAFALNDLLGTNSVPKSEFGVFKGEPCLVMDRVPGKEALKAFVAHPEAMRDPEIQRLTNHLEVNIYLMGNGDNHEGNYLVHYDPVGGNHRVTGIDNDQSFGKLMTDPDKAPKAGTAATSGYHHTGFPAVIDKPAYDKLMGLDFDRDVGPKLTKHLTAEELSAARDRLDNAQNKARDLAANGRVVEDWANWTQPGGAKAPGGNLFDATNGRDKIVQGNKRQLDRTLPPVYTEVPRSMLMRDKPAVDAVLERIQMAEFGF